MIKVKRWLALCMGLIALLSPFAHAATPVQEAQNSAQRAVPYLLTTNMQGFSPLALGLWGDDAPVTALHDIESTVQRDNLAYTDLARTILNVSALGYDPRYVYDRNVWELLWQTPHSDGVTVAGVSFSVLALTSVPLDAPDIRAFELSDLYALLLREQNDDGGFPVYLDDESDVNATAWVITALATRGSREDSAAIERATDYIERSATADGSFTFWGTESSEALAAVVAAYIATDNFKAFYYMQRLLDYQNDDGGFCRSRGGSSDYIATSQAMLALYSVYTGQSPYDLSKQWRNTPLTPDAGAPSMFSVVFSVLGALALIFLVLLAVSRYGQKRFEREQQRDGESPDIKTE